MHKELRVWEKKVIACESLYSGKKEKNIFKFKIKYQCKDRRNLEK